MHLAESIILSTHVQTSYALAIYRKVFTNRVKGRLIMIHAAEENESFFS
jgi:hypothetical protein